MNGFSTQQGFERWLLGGFDPEQAELAAVLSGDIAPAVDGQSDDGNDPGPKGKDSDKHEEQQAAGMRPGDTRRLVLVAGDACNQAMRKAVKHGVSACVAPVPDYPCWFLRRNVTVVFEWELLSEETRQHVMQDIASSRWRARIAAYGTNLSKEEKRLLARRNVIVASDLHELLETYWAQLMGAEVIAEVIPIPDEPAGPDAAVYSPLPSGFVD